MTPFYFKGDLPASKSILNRLLILQSYEPKLKILGDSDCDDVVEMRHALDELGAGHREPIDCGSAGTTFRFFALRASRLPGEHRLALSARLFARPQEELVQILRQLGVQAQFEHRVLVIQSKGWDKPKTPLKIDRSKSSQFASAVLLNSWGLTFDLEIEYTGVDAEGAVSEGYLEITEKLVSDVGMRLSRSGNKVLVPARSEIKPQEIRAETDLSSAFAVAAIAAVAGEATIQNFPESSSQPDAIFPEILKAMGVHVERSEGSLRIARLGSLKAVEWNLRNAPDLFPVLAVLCAFAEGTSRLFGAPQLAHKESSRIDSTARLIGLLKRKVEAKDDGAIIHGRRPAESPFPDEFSFNPDEDHRLAMAAGVAKAVGVRVKALNPSVVNKSFPGFWKLLEKKAPPKRVLVVGHRGTGKTKLLSRIQEYYLRNERSVTTVDLDNEISLKEARTVSQIFDQKGEAEFRSLEVTALKNLIEKLVQEPHDVFIALGAGFSGELPTGWEVLWLRRASDASGRIFFDRPRLNQQVTAYEEYLERFAEREKRYDQIATKTLTVSEGFDSPNISEEQFLLGTLAGVGGSITLLPLDFRLQMQLAEKVEQGFDYYELRDDLLSEQQMEIALTALPADHALISARDPRRTQTTLHLHKMRSSTKLDWASELGPPPADVIPNFVSFHSRDVSLSDTFERIAQHEKNNVAIKLAVEIKNFAELKEGHRWWQDRADTRIFLPSSQNGRWSWYRLLQKSNLNLNFIREGNGTSPDQPLLLDWVRMWPGGRFAAVLGNPVSHSQTPAKQYRYFYKRLAPVFAVHVEEQEWNEALEFLQELGLHWAAVTAPFKGKAFELCREKTEIAKQVAAVNTMVWTGEWRGTNTDVIGMQKALMSLERLIPNLDQRNIALWGGSGTLSALKNRLPNAIAFSARTGQRKDQRRDEKEVANWQPDLVVWSVDRSRWLQGKMQFPRWKPQVVWDLNYTENSPGREFALMTGAKYISGVEMFEAQAKAQREFWETHDS